MVDLHPVVVDNAEGATEGVLGVLTLAHLDGTGHLTDEAGSLGEALIDNELHHLEPVATKEPGLESLRHFTFLIINLYTINILNLILIFFEQNYHFLK